MARIRRPKGTTVDPEQVAFERKRAQGLCAYMLGQEVDPTRREAVATATDAELRALVEGNPHHPLAAGIREALDFIEAAES